MSFSSYFKKIRKDNKLTQKQLASILDVSETSIRNIETGKTLFVRHDLFNNLVSFVNKDPSDVAYAVFFENDREEYGHALSEINKSYLASIWNNDYVFIPAPHFKTSKNTEVVLDAVFWKSEHPYNKVLLGNISKEQYCTALNDVNKADSLRDLIFRETLIIERIDDLENIREIRFILDNNDPQDKLIYKEISKIKFRNLGRIVDISYLLFDKTTNSNNKKQDIYYVTDRRSKIEI